MTKKNTFSPLKYIHGYNFFQILLTPALISSAPLLLLTSQPFLFHPFLSSPASRALPSLFSLVFPSVAPLLVCVPLLSFSPLQLLLLPSAVVSPAAVEASLLVLVSSMK